MRRTLLSSALFRGLICIPAAYAEHQHHGETEHPIEEGIRFDAQFFVDAVAYDRSRDLSTQEALGIYNVHGGHDSESGEHNHGGGLDNGLNLNNAEAAFKVVAPGWVDGRLNLAMTSEGLELEEGWLRTQFLPAGFQLKGGKMLSDIGASNNLHPHAWDFVDQSLPYQMLFGGSLSGTGVQAQWQSTSTLALRLGVEALTADNEGVAAFVGSNTASSKGDPIHFAEKSAWPNVWTAFAKISTEIAPHHALHAGASWVDSDLHQELHTYHPGINDAEHGLQGKVSMFGIDAGYRFEGHDEHGAGDITLLAEYWTQNKDLNLTYHELKPQLIGQPRELEVDALSLQALYGIFPRWTVGLRYDQAGMTHEASRSAATVGPKNSSYFDPLDRVSGVLTWNINAQHQLRLQVSNISGTFAETPTVGGKDIATKQNFNEVFLQYQFNMGTKNQHSH
ncbi:MAG TPA: hypothetical protein ENO09_08560 [bacterium]|mgnify:CR=1 FL=1|nr:hypothetical protein [bacterium]